MKVPYAFINNSKYPFIAIFIKLKDSKQALLGTEPEILNISIHLLNMKSLTH